MVAATARSCCRAAAPCRPRRAAARSPATGRGRRAQQDEAVDREQEAREIAEQGGVGELGAQDALVPGGEIGGEEEAAERRPRRSAPSRGKGRPAPCRQASEGEERQRPAPAARSRRRPARHRPSRTIHGPAARNRLARISAGKARRGGAGWCISNCNPYLASHRRIPGRSAMPLPVRPDQARRHRCAQPHSDGAADPRPRDPRACADRADADLLRQRAGAGLIISEATGISRAGPRLAVRAGPVDRRAGRGLEAGHRGGARGGRADLRPALAYGPARPSELPRRRPPVSASATTAPYKAHTYDGSQPYAEARALRLDEIPDLIERLCARRRQCDARPASTASRSTPPTAI